MILIPMTDVFFTTLGDDVGDYEIKSIPVPVVFVSHSIAAMAISLNGKIDRYRWYFSWVSRGT